MAIASSGAEATSVPLLLTRDVSVQYGTLRALDGVDLEIRTGEVLALAGENGAGKSTLVRCIAGDKAPSRGEVFVAGRRLAANPAASARSGVAVVWQDLALCDNLDVAANLLLGRERRGLMLSDARFHAAASRLLAELEIPIGDTSQLVGSLSGGQRQLIAVARAMRDRPRLLILDEPTASLGVNESAQVEQLTASLQRQGTTILLVSHDIEQMFRLATRIVVLRHGRVVADVDPAESHPDEVVAAISGQELDSSARQQLSRLHGLVDRLASAHPSSSLQLILSALGAALGTERLCIHLREGEELRLAAAQGLPPFLAEAWAVLAVNPSGGPVGRAAATEQIIVEADTALTDGWVPVGGAVRRGRTGGSWSVPVVGADGLIGVITVLRSKPGRPDRDEQDLVSLYAGYAAGAVERDRLLAQLTARNQVLETIRDVLETLAGPVPLAAGLVLALQALRRGLEADEVALVSRDGAGEATWRASVDAHGERVAVSDPLLGLAGAVLDGYRRDGRAWAREAPHRGWHLAVTFPAPMGVTALLARWSSSELPPDSRALAEDAAHSLRLALEREESERATREAAGLRRSQELQRQFLSRLSHELRTPLTAIRGYASSLMQSDVTWDGDSEERFLTRIATESARLGRLVDDLLDFSAIESNVLRIQPDWCDLALVLDAARSCLAPAGAEQVSVNCPPGLPVVWADHDRLEQVFVNLLGNAVRHNPPGTRVSVEVVPGDPAHLAVSVSDNGPGPRPGDGTGQMPGDGTGRRGAGTGLGLSIAKGIVDAHGGRLEVEAGARGHRFVVWLPIEGAGADRPPDG